MPSVYDKVKYATIYQYTVGGLRIYMGAMAKDEKSAPQLYGAALSEKELIRENCGYGLTEAEAVLDLFRMMR